MKDHKNFENTHEIFHGLPYCEIEIHLCHEMGVVLFHWIMY